MIIVMGEKSSKTGTEWACAGLLVKKLKIGALDKAGAATRPASRLTGSRPGRCSEDPHCGHPLGLATALGAWWSEVSTPSAGGDGRSPKRGRGGGGPGVSLNDKNNEIFTSTKGGLDFLVSVRFPSELFFFEVAIRTPAPYKMY